MKGLAQGHTACQWLGQRPLTAPQVPVPTPPPPVSKEIEPLKVYLGICCLVLRYFPASLTPRCGHMTKFWPRCK